MGLNSLNMAGFTDDDRKRLHELLDYALDTAQDFVIMQFARADLDFHIQRTIYKMNIKKEDYAEDRK